jgi:hypothetical protein
VPCGPRSHPILLTGPGPARPAQRFFFFLFFSFLFFFTSHQ